MGWTLVTAPTKEPVTLPEAKLHLRVDGTDDDDLINALITTARVHVESITRRKLLTQTWDYTLSDWPCAAAFKLPFGNLQNVTSVKWKDEDGTETTLTPTTDYLVETNGSECGRIVLPYGGTWPSGTLYPSNAITVRYVCGWTTDENVPYPIKAAIKLLLTKLYESRGEDTVGAGQTVHEDKTMLLLLQPYRLWDF
jgi:uncharacterized phiE125 gp8 family phage protein